MSSGSQPNYQVVTQNIDPAMQPYIAYGLQEAQRLYQDTGTPSFYPGATYVAPTAATQQALQYQANRAVQGNPLLPQSQQTVSNIQSSVNPAIQMMQGTAQGDYLSGNPFFQGAFSPAAQAAEQAYSDAMQRVASQASQAGRYGSNAMGQLQDRATGQFAQSLANTAGQLAYQNYAAERGMQEAARGNIGALSAQDYARQLQAAGMGPGMAAADYGDIQSLYDVGQAQESYQQAALADAMARYNFQQTLPQQKLTQFLSAAYGAPMGSQTAQPIYRNVGASALGGALAGQSLFGGAGAVGGGLAGLLGFLG